MALEVKPAAPWTADPDDAAAAERPSAAAPVDILVVDDNAANLLAVEAALEGLGANLISVQSGAAALRCLLDRDFALILLDVQMPTMDGYETARMIRGRERSRDTPIIFVTAFERDERQTLLGYRLGAVDFLFKPVIPEVLRTKAQVFVTLHQRNREVAAQAKLLAAAESLELRRQLDHDRQEWEAATLRGQMEKEKRNADALARKAAELAGAVATLERTERELTELNHELAAADQRKVEFLAILSHELRNSLAPMVNSLEFLRGQAPLDAPALRAHHALGRQVDHLRRLVDDLLDLSRIDSGTIELKPEATLLTGLVGDAITMTGPLFAARRQRLVVRQPEVATWLHADPTRILQVLVNLLSNASRYSRVGAEARLEVASEGDEVVVRVIDQGDGIAPELLPRVFEGFVQGKRGGGGLGIGLTVSRKLVERHAGSLRAHSEGVGRGSTFELRLPRHAPASEVTATDATATATAATTAPAAEAGAAAAPVALSPGESLDLGDEPTSPVGRGGLHVVLIEDNDDIRETTQTLLELCGHQVDTAADGPSGVELVLRARPQVALVDIGLPGFDGHEVATRLRRALPPGQLRLVAMTGFGQASDRQQALESGFDDHLTKPASAAQLRLALRATAASPSG